jgi:hypothetical protein
MVTMIEAPNDTVASTLALDEATQGYRRVQTLRAFTAAQMEKILEEKGGDGAPSSLGVFLRPPSGRDQTFRTKTATSRKGGLLPFLFGRGVTALGAASRRSSSDAMSTNFQPNFSPGNSGSGRAF